jgi:hypothetical protein
MKSLRNSVLEILVFLDSIPLSSQNRFCKPTGEIDETEYIYYHKYVVPVLKRL